MTYTEEQAKQACLEYFNNDFLAADTVVKKYLLRNLNGELLEVSPTDMHRRLAKEFARIESNYPSPLSEEEILSQLERFSKIIPQGSPMYGIGNPRPVSLSNCVVIDSPKDNISAIFEGARDIANLSKRRCGIGVDISQLRPDGTVVNNAAQTTTGAWSFADLYSYTLRKIGQKGRRGAGMISIDVRHPDIEKFITMKKDLTKVTGANISIRIRDDFMEAVEADTDFTLRWPVDSKNPSITRIVKAKELWSLITTTATTTAEPGLMMWDNIINHLPAHCYKGFETLTTNPCGEVPLSAYDSCRLITINLTSFVQNPYTSQANFNIDDFKNTVRIAMRLCDDLVDLELEKLELIYQSADTEDEKVLWQQLRNSCEKGRRTGLGTTGLADALAMLNLEYGSTNSLYHIENLYEIFKLEAYKESASLAQERGAFPVWKPGVEEDCKFFDPFPLGLVEKMEAHGRRNISILTNAPTGSCSILAQCSSGIEPIYRLEYTRRKKLSHDELENSSDFIDKDGEKWKEFTVFHHAYNEYRKLTKKTTSSKFFVTSDQIDWSARIDVQAAIQRHIDHSISSTINLPKGTPVDVVKELYMKAWKEGLKGVTVYVEGSRAGVLVSKDIQSTKDLITETTAPKRPQELPCEIHHRSVKGEKWTILLGLLDDKPYEVFAGPAENIDIATKFTTGTIFKYPRKTINSRYDLEYGENGGTTKIKNIVKWFENDDYGTMSRLVSMNLRHGVPIHYICEQLQKDPNGDLLSFNKVLGRVLKTHIPDGTDRDRICGECNNEGLTYQEGCLTCTSCGYTKCN